MNDEPTVSLGGVWVTEAQLRAKLKELEDKKREGVVLKPGMIVTWSGRNDDWWLVLNTEKARNTLDNRYLNLTQVVVPLNGKDTVWGVNKLLNGLPIRVAKNVFIS